MSDERERNWQKAFDKQQKRLEYRVEDSCLELLEFHDEGEVTLKCNGFDVTITPHKAVL